MELELSSLARQPLMMPMTAGLALLRPPVFSVLAHVQVLDNVLNVTVCKYHLAILCFLSLTYHISVIYALIYIYIYIYSCIYLDLFKCYYIMYILSHVLWFYYMYTNVHSPDKIFEIPGKCHIKRCFASKIKKVIAIFIICSTRICLSGQVRHIQILSFL